MSLIHSHPPLPPSPSPLMSLTFSDSPSHSSNWDGGQVPPRTLRLINHPRFNICPVPKAPPAHITPSLVKMGPWLYSSFQHPSILSQLTPPPRLTKHLFSHVQVKKRPSFPLFDKRRLKPRWRLPAKMPGTRQGCPPPPPVTLSSRPRVHPSFAFALFFTFSTPLLRGSLTQRALTPFRVANSQPHIKTSSDSAERKRPDLAERDIRHGCQ